VIVGFSAAEKQMQRADKKPYQSDLSRHLLRELPDRHSSAIGPLSLAFRKPRGKFLN